MHTLPETCKTTMHKLPGHALLVSLTPPIYLLILVLKKRIRVNWDTMTVI